MKILVIFAHPAVHKSRVNSRMIQEIQNIDGITFHDLYESYPDNYILVDHEKKLLFEHDIIVWHHPFYWYSCPPLMKEWIDLVLEHGWAYGRNGTNLKGKKVISSITTGGHQGAYVEGGFNNHTIHQFLLPFKQTVKLCYMDYYPPFVVHGTHLLYPPDIEQKALEYKEILISLRNELFDEADIKQCNYLNDLLNSPKTYK